MKTYFALLAFTIAFVMICFAGCTPSSNKAETITEGVILYVEYQGDVGHEGFTRLNKEKMPVSFSRWNIDANGKLTREYLFITYPQRPDLGTMVIPVNRLINLSFGDGGIKKVDENQTTPAE